MPITLDSASKKKISQLIATVNAWPELETRGYLEDHPEKALQLARTLKHYANPLGNYTKDNDVCTALSNMLKALNDPHLLQPTSSLNLTEEERAFLKELLRVKLDQLANDIVTEYHLDMNALQDNPPPYEEQPRAHSLAPAPIREDIWWNRLSHNEKRAIEERYHNLHTDQQTHLNTRITVIYPGAPDQHYYRYYQMSLIESELNYLSLRTTIDLTELTIRLVAYSAEPIARAAIQYATTPSSKNNKKDDSENSLAAILALGLLIAAATTACLYAIKKMFDSIHNLSHGYKPLRSLFKLSGIITGALLGPYPGSYVGAMLGNAAPSIGLASGAFLGVFAGAALGAGVGYLIAKHLAKAISRYWHADEFNPSNPDKWKLSESQKQNLTRNGFDLNQINQQMRSIKQRKDAIGFSSNFFWTEAKQQKDRLNAELAQLKGSRFYPPRYEWMTRSRPVQPVVIVEQRSSYQSMRP